jgi:hypothetical protein
MKQAGKLILASLLAIMMVLPFVMAAESVLETFGRTIFGFSGYTPKGGGSEIVVQLMIWLILFVAFADILELIFSDITRWIIGGALAVIAANAGWITAINNYMFQATAALGSFSVATVIGITFVAFLGAHFGLGWAVDWITQAKRMKAIREADFKIKGGMRALAGVGEEMKRIGTKNTGYWIKILITFVILVIIVWIINSMKK